MPYKFETMSVKEMTDAMNAAIEEVAEEEEEEEEEDDSHAGQQA